MYSFVNYDRGPDRQVAFLMNWYLIERLLQNIDENLNSQCILQPKELGV